MGTKRPEIDWTTSELAHLHGVQRYYIRIATTGQPQGLALHKVENPHERTLKTQTYDTATPR